MCLSRCTICGKAFDPGETPAPPFCSERCKRIDLARWLDERYGLPYESENESEEPDTADQGPEAGS